MCVVRIWQSESVQVNEMFGRVKEIKIRDIGRAREIKTVKIGNNIKTKTSLKDGIMQITDDMSDTNI